MKGGSLLIALCLVLPVQCPAQSVRAGLCAWVANGDQLIYEGGGFVSIREKKLSFSGDFLVGTAEMADCEGLTSTRIDAKGTFGYPFFRDGEVRLSLLGGVIYRQFEFVPEHLEGQQEPAPVAAQDATGPIVGISFSARPLSGSIAAAKLEGKSFIVPTVSLSAQLGGGWGLFPGYRGEIRRDKPEDPGTPTNHGVSVRILFAG